MARSRRYDKGPRRTQGRGSLTDAQVRMMRKRQLGRLSKAQMLDVIRNPIAPGSLLMYSEKLNKMVWVPPAPEEEK